MIKKCYIAYSFIVHIIKKYLIFSFIPYILSKIVCILQAFNVYLFKKSLVCILWFSPFHLKQNKFLDGSFTPLSFVFLFKIYTVIDSRERGLYYPPTPYHIESLLFLQSFHNISKKQYNTEMRESQ